MAFPVDHEDVDGLIGGHGMLLDEVFEVHSGFQDHAIPHEFPNVRTPSGGNSEVRVTFPSATS